MNHLFEEPLVSFCSAFCFLLPPFLDRCIVFLLRVGWWIFTKQPLVAFPDVFGWGFRGVLRGFSSPTIRALGIHTPPMSGGRHDMKHSVEVTAKPPLIPASLHKL